MEPMRIDEVLEATGGALAAGEAEGAVGAVCIDSRRARPGGLFIALKGVRFDGHDYIPEALRKGCRAVVFSSPDVPARTAARGIAFIRVADTLDAFARIAQRHRSRFELPLVAVTGSNGKTTTKEMIRAIAASRFSVLASEGTFNNFVGVPLTLLRIEAWHSLAVLELGMNARGEIRRLAEIAAPDVGVVTNVGPAHLEFLETLENVAAAKAELIEELHGGTAVVPGAAALLAPHLRRHDGRVVTFGTEESDVRFIAAERRGAGTHVLVDAFTQRAALDFGFTGAHYLYDAQAALAAFVELGFRLDEARVGAGRVVFSEMRGETVALRDGGLLVNDAYNANPVATQAALDHLVQLAGGREAVAVLGDMAELGPGAAAYHAAVGEHAVRLGVRIVAVGDLARHYLTGSPGERWFRTVEECLAYVREAVPPRCAVLVKASRAMRLERVAEAIVAASGGAAEGDDAEVGVGVAKDEEDGDA